MELPLININDVQEFRRIDPKYNIDKFNGFVMSVQRRNLREFLGDPLYYDMMDTPTIEKYVKLINGDTYTRGANTVSFYGLRAALVYWWLAVATREGDLYHSGYGAVNFTNNPQQHFQENKNREAIAKNYMEEAQTYINDAVNYLTENRATYPLWEIKGEEKGTSFVMFSV